MQAAYIAIMRNASTTNRNGFESLLKIYKEADAVHEKERILGMINSIQTTVECLYMGKF